VLAAVLIGGVPAADAAKIDAGDVKNADTRVSDDPVPSGETGSGFVPCPTGSRVFSGGAFWYTTGGPAGPSMAGGVHAITSSLPTTSGNAWYAHGFNESGVDLTLRVIAQCLPAGKLSGTKLRKKTLRVEIDPPAVGSRQAKCPDETRLYTGGALWSPPGSDSLDLDTADDTLLSTSAPLGQRTWYANGRNLAAVPRDLIVVALCLKSTKLESYSRRQAGVEITPPGSGLFSRQCKRGGAVGPAGLLWHKPGKDPKESHAERTRFVSAGGQDDPTFFHGGGVLLSGSSLRLDVRSYCVDR
jgi:hypothetical protein